MDVCVTVAIPVYNRKALVQRAVTSALAQDVPRLEVIVVDNRSTDGTWDALRSYESDSRLRLFRNERNLGLFANFNRCLSLAHGTYVRFLCSDDRLLPGCLRREVDIMERHREVVLLSSSCRQVDSEGRELGYAADIFPPGMYAGREAIPAVLWCLAHHSSNPLNYPSGILLRGEALRMTGEFDTSYQMTADVELFLRLLRRGDLAIIEATGCEITMHPGMESANLVAEAVRDRELHRLLLSYRTLFPTEVSFERAVEELAGHAVAVGVKYLLTGKSAVGMAHVSCARKMGASWRRMVRTALGQAWRRFSPSNEWNNAIPLPVAEPIVPGAGARP